jgi:signal peptidase I
MSQENAKGRNRLLAVFLGLMMPGLGQIYNGEMIKGLSFFMIGLSIMIMGIRQVVFMPDKLLLFGTLATLLACLALYIASIFDAYKKASLSDSTFLLKSYNRWYFYLAVLLLGNVITISVYGYVKDNYLEAFHIPTGSMEPTIKPGDYILADKTAYRRMPPKKGDLVIFLSPDDRSKRFIKRIEALPGDIITEPDGTRKSVPHGYAYVLGDNRSNSIDSRQMGFLPFGDIIAKARQIYWSAGREGIRWSRIARIVD